MRVFRRALIPARVPVLLLFVAANLLSSVALSGCNPTRNSAEATPAPPKDAVEVKFAYSSEKKPWIEPLAAQFNKEKHTVPGSKLQSNGKNHRMHVEVQMTINMRQLYAVVYAS